MEENNLRRRRKKVRGKRFWTVFIIIVVVLVSVFFVGMYIFKNTTYNHIEVVTNYGNDSTHGGNYIEYAGGVLEYSRDGIAMLTEQGEELWNQPCQMDNPIADVCKDAVAVADQGGTSIYVFHKDGLKGEIQTTRPIERVSVSAQGVVAAILQEEENPRVMCYDAKGNILVEHKTSFANTGYPIAIDLAQDGKMLLVSYLCAQGNGVVSRVAYYDFGESKSEKEDKLVTQKEYKDTIIPTVYFINKKKSLFVTDKSIILYEGLDEPKEKAVIKVNREIQSIDYNEQYIALVTKNSKGTGYELSFYRNDGKQLMHVPIEAEYTKMKVSGKQVLLYDESKCAIYNADGICKFKGALEMQVLDMFAISGANKYMVISAGGFQEIRLAK